MLSRLTRSAALESLVGERGQDGDAFDGVLAEHLERGAGFVGEGFGELLDGGVGERVRLDEDVADLRHVLEVFAGLLGRESERGLCVGEQVGRLCHVEVAGLGERGDLG